MIERDGKKYVPEPKIVRFEILRGSKHNGHPYIETARFPAGKPLRYLRGRELIHGYVYERPDGEEEISALPFMFRYDNWDLSPRDHGGMPRVLPVAVMVKIDV